VVGPAFETQTLIEGPQSMVAAVSRNGSISGENEVVTANRVGYQLFEI
jgi:hypothetical protein